MAAVRRLALAGAVALIGTLSLSAAPAGAAIGYINLCPTLETALCVGLGGAVNDYGYAVAVDNSSGPSSGDVWFGGLGLKKYDPSGNVLLEVTEDIPGGELEALAVDPTSGDVYVATSGGVAKF